MTTRLLTLSLLLLTACKGDPETTPTTDTSPTGPTEPTEPTEPTGTPTDAPTWIDDIAPIVRDRCATCHQPGGIGPFDLTDYATAKTWGQPSKNAVQARTMPPYLVTADGTCGDWTDPQWLSDEEISKFTAWVDAGMPEGGTSTPFEPPAPRALDRVDLTLSTPTFVPEIVGGATAEFDEYRCFVITDPTDTDRFLTGFEVVPGNDAVVHHVLGMPLDLSAQAWDGRTNGENLAEMDGADGRDGWPCFGTAGGNLREDGIPVVWAPGMGAVEYPDGVGVRLGADEVFVIQVHYNLVDPAVRGQSDRTEVRLRTEASVTDEAFFAFPDAFLESLFYGRPDEIPPGESAYAYSYEISGLDTLFYGQAPLLGRPLRLVGVMPHMHGIGSSQTMTLHRSSGGDECLAEVPRWDFAWQLVYFYEQPIEIGLQDRFEITCTFDSTGRTEPTLPGWGTGNEMCLMVLMFVP